MQHRYSLAILCAFTLTLALTVDSSNVITSPETCLRTADCPSHQFCDTEGEKNRYRCKALRPEGAPCRDGVCAHGLYCPQADKGRRCTPKLAINALCEQPSGSFSYLEVDDPCAGADARCVYGRDNKYRCRRDFGKEGDLCLGDVDCNVAQGLVCPSNRCEPRSPVGSYCDHTHPLTYCVGFCALYGTDHAGYEGTCARAPAPGMPCRLHNECQGYDPPAQSGRFLLLCNFIRNRRGLCARAADLLKTLGAPCNPRHDLCDAERGLSCRWWHAKRRFVCQQAASDRDTPIYYKQDNRFCDPTKPSLSRCFPFNGLPMTCRPATSPRHNGFYHCARPVERVPIGAPCNENFAACPKSAVCATVPGVRTVPGVYTGPRSTDTSHKACRRVVSAGMSCANKFTTMCKGSLVCVRGKCRMPAQTPNSGGSNGSTNNTHSGLTVSCGPKSLPCVPGTVCDVSNESMQRRCLLPKQVVGLGQVCFSSARIRRVCVPPFAFCFSAYIEAKVTPVLSTKFGN